MFVNERWKKVNTPEQFDLEISNYGRVKSKGKIQDGSKNNSGFRRISVSSTTDGKKTYYQKLIHRLVAEYFCPSDFKKEFIIHIDYDKGNNRATNLKGVDREGLNEYTRFSPGVLKNRQNIERGLRTTGNFKLNVTKVMAIKKMINNGKAVSVIAKNFKVSQSHIRSIKCGLFWKDIQAAK